jgi:hypothetical protein
MRDEYDFSKAKRGAVIPSPGKTRIAIMLDDDVIEHFRAQAEAEGVGYQTLVNAFLRKAAKDCLNQGEAGARPEYHAHMQVVTGTVIKGKVVLESAELPEGAKVTVLVRESGAAVRLPADLQAELEDALDEADRTEGISAEDLFEQLRKYG